MFWRQERCTQRHAGESTGPGERKDENGPGEGSRGLAHARRKIHDKDVRRPTEMTQEALRRIAE